MLWTGAWRYTRTSSVRTACLCGLCGWWLLPAVSKRGEFPCKRHRGVKVSLNYAWKPSPVGGLPLSPRLRNIVRIPFDKASVRLPAHA